MARRSGEPNNGDKELARFFEQRRGDTSLWAEKPTQAKVRRGGTVVFSVRFAPNELEALRRRAEAQNVTISELIRRAVLESTERPSRVVWIGDPSVLAAIGEGTAALGQGLIRLPSLPQGVSLTPETANV